MWESISCGRRCGRQRLPDGGYCRVPAWAGTPGPCSTEQCAYCSGDTRCIGVIAGWRRGGRRPLRAAVAAQAVWDAAVWGFPSFLVSTCPRVSIFQSHVSDTVIGRRIRTLRGPRVRSSNIPRLAVGEAPPEVPAPSQYPPRGYPRGAPRPSNVTRYLRSVPQISTSEVPYLRPLPPGVVRGCLRGTHVVPRASSGVT